MMSLSKRSGTTSGTTEERAIMGPSARLTLILGLVITLLWGVGILLFVMFGPKSSSRTRTTTLAPVDITVSAWATVDPGTIINVKQSGRCLYFDTSTSIYRLAGPRTCTDADVNGEWYYSLTAGSLRWQSARFGSVYLNAPESTVNAPAVGNASGGRFSHDLSVDAGGRWFYQSQRCLKRDAATAAWYWVNAAAGDPARLCASFDV